MPALAGGFSGGAAQAQLMGYATQEWLDTHVAVIGKQVTASVVIVAPPNVGDQTFVDAYNARVNSRRVSSSEGDGV